MYNNIVKVPNESSISRISFSSKCILDSPIDAISSFPILIWEDDKSIPVKDASGWYKSLRNNVPAKRTSSSRTRAFLKIQDLVQITKLALLMYLTRSPQKVEKYILHLHNFFKNLILIQNVHGILCSLNVIPHN